MADFLKNTLDIKTVIMCVIFITGLVANNLKTEYTIELLIKDIQNRINLQERDILEIKNILKK